MYVWTGVESESEAGRCAGMYHNNDINLNTVWHINITIHHAPHHAGPALLLCALLC